MTAPARHRGGAMELHEVHRQLSQFATYAFREPVVTVDCFSMGAWSTGINTAQALHRNGMVKSPGPDLEKVLDPLRFLGPAQWRSSIRSWW